MTKLTERAINNFKKAIKDLDESIPKTERELSDAKECLEYMSLNYYDENIEKKIVDILNFYTNDVQNTLDNAEIEKEYYEDYLDKNTKDNDTKERL